MNGKENNIKNIEQMPGKIAETTITGVFDEFMSDQRKRLKPKTLRKYENSIEYFAMYVNDYAHENLSEQETELFEKHSSAKGKDRKTFCQVFGPEKIIENLGGFLNYFMIRKVLAGAEAKQAAGTVAKKLSKWLAEKGYVTEESARDGIDEAAAAARDLPKAERAAQILFEAADELRVDTSALGDEDYMEFDHYEIVNIEPGKLWFEDIASGRTLGPVPVPKKATELLKARWEVSCAFGRIRGVWRLIEVANVYPL
jgi:hypothetical protein